MECRPIDAVTDGFGEHWFQRFIGASIITIAQEFSICVTLRRSSVPRAPRSSFARALVAATVQIGPIMQVTRLENEMACAIFELDWFACATDAGNNVTDVFQ